VLGPGDVAECRVFAGSDGEWRAPGSARALDQQQLLPMESVQWPTTGVPDARPGSRPEPDRSPPAGRKPVVLRVTPMAGGWDEIRASARIELAG